jgi:hypothetical protein
MSRGACGGDPDRSNRAGSKCTVESHAKLGMKGVLDVT